MNDKVEHPILEHLRAMRADMSSIKDEMTGMRSEMTGMRSEMIVMRTHMAALLSSQTLQDTEIASIKVRVDRIEKRLDLVE